MATVRPRARRLDRRSEQVVTRGHEAAAAIGVSKLGDFFVSKCSKIIAAAARGRRSDSSMNRLRRSDVCWRISQHTDVLRYLLEENPPSTP